MKNKHPTAKIQGLFLTVSQKNLLMLIFQDFTIIDVKETPGATSFMNIFSFFVTSEAHKKGRALRPGRFFADDIYKSLFDFEFVIIGFVLIQIFTPAAKSKTICGLFVLKWFSAE